jgi:hypothetical protein
LFLGSFSPELIAPRRSLKPERLEVEQSIWAGFDTEDTTWKPALSLSGSPELITAFPDTASSPPKHLHRSDIIAGRTISSELEYLVRRSVPAFFYKWKTQSELDFSPPPSPQPTFDSHRLVCIPIPPRTRIESIENGIVIQSRRAYFVYFSKGKSGVVDATVLAKACAELLYSFLTSCPIEEHKDEPGLAAELHY